MSTSGTYNFGSPQSEQIINDAYERIGIIEPAITQQKIQAAQRSLNFILQDWVNKGNNLWTIRHGMLGLTNNQAAYNLPPNAIDIKTAAIRTSNRNLGGVPFSSAGGNAQYAFDYNPTTSCIQTSPNGYISYSWNGSTNPLQTANYLTTSMVGVQSTITQTYTLVGEYSLDGITWLNCLTIPAQAYAQNIIEWFVVPVPVPAKAFRIRETGGATLQVEELYFNTFLYDTIVTRLSEYEYTALPNKNQVGRPTSFWVDRQISPVIYLWPVPYPYYNNLYFTYWEALQDVGSMIDNAEIPARFLEALCAELAARLAMKEGVMDRYPILQAIAQQAYKTAGDEDRERVPLRIFGSYTQGWSMT